MAAQQAQQAQQGQRGQQGQRVVRRIWKTPGSWYNWLYLVLSIIILGWIILFDKVALATQPYPGPFNEPFRAFGIVGFALVILTAAYTLRRRFVRRLPGRVQNWLWLHTWFGIISIAIVVMHDNFQNVTHDTSFMQTRLTEYGYGTTAMYALFVLVLTGMIGRVLDSWQARVIAAEADTNGVGITRSVEDRLFELSLTVGRLRAGKSAQFKQYCEEVLSLGSLPGLVPMLSPNEVEDFQQVYVILIDYARLSHSLKRQKRARLIIRGWRYAHILLACLAFYVISYHSIYELYKMIVLHY